MSRTYWHRQASGKALFPELVWSRPENRQRAGKLLVAGGNAHGFAAVAEAYAEAMRAGIGTARALLPEALRKLVGIIIEQAEFAPSTPVSGSFSQKALDELLDASTWADGVLFAGDLGRNAETAILLEKFLAKSPQAVTLTKDAADYVASTPQPVLARPGTALVLSLAQLQRLAVAAKFGRPVRFGMDLLQLVDWLHDFTAQFAPYIVVKHLDTIFAAVGGQVSTTKLPPSLAPWRVKTAARVSVWWLQNPATPFEALTTAVCQ